MSTYAIKTFHSDLERLKHFGGSNKENAIYFTFQYKEKKPGDPTIAEKFNTYKFADYKEQVIDLLQRVCTVSVETMKIVEAMP